MSDEEKIFDDESIRDTNSHDSSSAISGEMECRNLFIENGLDQTVALQFQGSMCDGNTWINIGSSFNVATVTNSCHAVTEYFSLYRVQASCSVTPTSGDLNITMLKSGR